MKSIDLSNWTIEYNGKKLQASVPGDITIDLFNAGIIKDPYYGLNYQENVWIARTDFTYETEIIVDKKLFNEESVEVVFDGVDVFSDVFLNGELIGSTENMFMQYRFNLKNKLKLGKNILNVRMKGTLNEMDKFDVEGYGAAFNLNRLFVRKAQCHFGWDWAPKICAYGIWQNVRIEYGKKAKINSVFTVADDEGNLTIFSELNYDWHKIINDKGENVNIEYIENANDILHYYLSEKPFGDTYIKKSFSVVGKKNFACFKIDNPELWWPLGYGKQPLYNYKVELERNGEIVSVKEGRIGFRTVKLVEKPKADNYLGYELFINNQMIFAKGANWVPIECFTGVVKDEKYRRHIELAVNANYNMFRVWGGGYYEKDIFYDLCDENGILVWQDVMFACGDIPEDKPLLVKNVLNEVEYQVKRLRNHPSLVYWCGGNEMTGSCGRGVRKGDYLVNVLLRGAILNLDDTRPYSVQSPCSHTDVGQDKTSGDNHYNSFERALVDGLDKYRELVSEVRVPFISEAALMGPNTVEANKRIYPKNKLWPMNELWDDRLMDNPYSGLNLAFTKRQLKYASDLYGEVTTLENFTAKAMLAHAECMRAESEFARNGKGLTSGFMAWMYNDIWPSGSWSVLDYWCEPKQVLYQMQRSFEPRLVTFVENSKKQTVLTVINDTLIPYSTDISYGVKSFDGKILFKDFVSVKNLSNEVFEKIVDFDCDRKDVYLFVEYTDGNKVKTNLYSPKMWAGVKFISDYTYKIDTLSKNKIKVTVKANSFAKSVFISFKDNYKYTYSDNYIDVEAGSEKSVIVTSNEEIKLSEITVTDFAKMTEK